MRPVPCPGTNPPSLFLGPANSPWTSDHGRMCAESPTRFGKPRFRSQDIPLPHPRYIPKKLHSARITMSPSILHAQPSCLHDSFYYVFCKKRSNMPFFQCFFFPVNPLFSLFSLSPLWSEAPHVTHLPPRSAKKNNIHLIPAFHHLSVPTFPDSDPQKSPLFHPTKRSPHRKQRRRGCPPWVSSPPLL